MLVVLCSYWRCWCWCCCSSCSCWCLYNIGFSVVLFLRMRRRFSSWMGRKYTTNEMYSNFWMPFIIRKQCTTHRSLLFFPGYYITYIPGINWYPKYHTSHTYTTWLQGQTWRQYTFFRLLPVPSVLMILCCCLRGNCRRCVPFFQPQQAAAAAEAQQQQPTNSTIERSNVNPRGKALFKLL